MTTIQFRWHRGGLEASMATLIAGTADEILRHIAQAGYQQVFTKPYGGADLRIGWKDTHIVLAVEECSDHPFAVGFTDAPLPEKMTAMSNSPTTGQWISVDDRLPEPDTDVLCTLPANLGNPARVRALHWASGKGLRKPKPRWEEIQGCLAWTLPTHWMPYPAPFTKETP